MKPLILSVLLLFVSCPQDRCDSRTGPSAVPDPVNEPSIVDEVPQDDYMRAETEVDFHQVVGVTAFSLATADEAEGSCTWIQHLESRK
ncbi:MAG: hypothetical protein ACW99G_23845 [Candidatus Thorarchaeota archaeon]|jgi:hypothetical protein